MDISRSSGYRDFVWATELNRAILKFAGVWPDINEAPSKTFALRPIFILIMFVWFTGIPFIHALVRVWGNLILVAENLQVTLPMLTCFAKFAIMWWKRTAMLSIIQVIQEDWVNLKLKMERNVMVRQARFARLCAIAGYVVAIVMFNILIVLPVFGISYRHLTNLTDRNRVLPLQTYYFYDTDKSPQYELMIAVQAIALFLALLIYFEIDAFFGLAILHICGQLENFRYRLSNLLSCNDFNSAFSNCVKTHLRLIRFAGDIEDLFTFIMMSLVILFCIAFCFYGFLALTIITDEGISSLSSAYLYIAMAGVVILFVYMFLYCSAGELMANQCEEVHRAICDLEWYKLEYKNKRNLILLMMCANDSFRITAGKIIPLVMTTFASLLKTTAGYISFLIAKRS